MTNFRFLAIIAYAMAAIASSQILLVAQSSPVVNQPDSVSIHLSFQKNSYYIGEKPTADMSIKNISSNEICFSTATFLYRIHVTNQDGEPPKTEFHRHLLGDFRPGDGPALRSDSICRDIEPGSLDAQHYDLTRFYDLSKPGDYNVYLEIYDPAGPEDGSGHWLRTNTAHFKIQPPDK
jgi:hypothetical protein